MCVLIRCLKSCLRRHEWNTRRMVKEARRQTLSGDSQYKYLLLLKEARTGGSLNLVIYWQVRLQYKQYGSHQIFRSRKYALASCDVSEIIFSVFCLSGWCKIKYPILQFVFRKQGLDNEFDYLYAKRPAVLVQIARKFWFLSKLW